MIIIVNIVNAYYLQNTVLKDCDSYFTNFYNVLVRLLI